MQALLVLQILSVVGLVAVILVQKTSSDGFTGASSPSAFLSGRAQANLFTRITAILATIFIVNSLVLAYIASHEERGGSIIKKLKSKEVTQEKSKKTEEIISKKDDAKQSSSKKAKELKSDIEEKSEDNSVVPISE
ncbi:MAG: preprotein translocase subunit SecG [Rickettsiales bacterium]|nr:preprotein translocase subunit SecG [Rickettsiales bacterium]